MKRLFFVLLSCFCAYHVFASHNIIRYIDTTGLYRNGADLWLVKENFEWPLILSNAEVAPLQKLLAEYLYGVEANSYTEGRKTFYTALGEPIDSMPDDDTIRRHYLTLKLLELWLESDRYITLYLERQETDGEGKTIEMKHRYITYDMQMGREVRQEDLFNQRRLFGSLSDVYRVPFEALLTAAAHVDDNDYSNIYLTKMPQEIALMGNSIVFDLGGSPQYNNIAALEINHLDEYLSRDGHKYLAQKSSPLADVSHLPRILYEGDSIYDIVDSVAQFPGGQKEMYNFLSQNIVYPELDALRHAEGRVIVSFCVEKDGSRSNYEVIKPLSPGLDRESVRVLRMMPNWKPATKNNHLVRNHITVPIVYKLR